jgi:hypothetical protein
LEAFRASTEQVNKTWQTLQNILFTYEQPDETTKLNEVIKMSNTQISFRLSPYQLARGLRIIRLLEPNHAPSSLSQLVKTIYIDYLAKTSLQSGGDVTPADLLEIESIIQTKQTPMSLKAFQTLTSGAPTVINEPSKSTDPDKSVITSVSDFSPPDDWTEES